MCCCMPPLVFITEQWPHSRFLLRVGWHFLYLTVWNIPSEFAVVEKILYEPKTLQRCSSPIQKGKPYLEWQIASSVMYILWRGYSYRSTQTPQEEVLFSQIYRRGREMWMLRSTFALNWNSLDTKARLIAHIMYAMNQELLSHVVKWGVLCIVELLRLANWVCSSGSSLLVCSALEPHVSWSEHLNSCMQG